MVEWAQQPNVNLSSTQQPGTGLPVVLKDDLDFSKSANYVNRTQRYVLRIPELQDGGELMIYPEGTPKAGKAIKKCDEGTPDRGVIFYNGKDRVWQGARGNGKEAILITGVGNEQANLLDEKEREILKDLPAHTLETVKALLTYANNGLALIDAQPKKAAAVEKEMGAIKDSCLGHMIVTKGVQHKAVYVKSGFVFQSGPVEQTYPEGAVLVTDGKYVWGVAKDVFATWFKRSEGEQEIDLVSLDDEFGQK